MLGGFQSRSGHGEGQKNICIRFWYAAQNNQCMYRFPKLLDRLWDSPGLLLDAYRGFCPGVERPERGEINQLQPSSRMSGSIPLISLISLHAFMALTEMILLSYPLLITK